MDKVRLLQHENAELKKQLKEAQQTIQEIQDGGVDAVVVHGKKGQQLYSLHNTTLTQVLESIGDAFIATDSKWRYTYINKRAETLLKRKRSDLLGKVCWDVFKTPKESMRYKMAMQAMKEQKNIVYETYDEALRKWFIVKLYPSKEGLTTFFDDVTYEKESQEKLKESEIRFHTLTANAPVGIFMTDTEGNCMYVNQTWEQLAGISLEKARGRGWAGIIHPEDKALVFAEWQKAVTRKKSFHLEYRFQTPKGSVSWLEGNAVSLKNDKGKVVGFIGTVSDITSRKIAEEELLRSQERLMLAQDAGRIGTFEWLVTKNKVIWTPELERLYGLQKGAFEGTYGGWKKLVHPDDVSKVESHIRDVIERRGIYNHEFRIILPDGKIRWLLGNGKVFVDPKTQSVRMVGVNIDITARKILEQQKDEFISIASHELKTPVTSIKGYGQVLKMMLERSGERKGAEIVGKMDAQLNKLTDLIGDLLDVTKIEAGRLQLTTTEFVFNDLASEVIESLQLTTNKHKLIQKGHIKHVVRTDRDRISQVMTNLISNAIKYSPHSKKIIIHSQVIEKDVMVCVQDFGVGIPKDKKDQVFERFFRVSGPNTSTFPGLGLGLYISSEIIKRLGGKIWVESTKGKGSTFCFRIPLKKRIERKSKKSS